MAEPETDESVHGGRDLYSASVTENAAMRALGIDVGGTFTDAVLARRTARSASRRCPRPRGRRSRSSPRRAAVGATDVDRFTHGTTIATNALLERRGRAHGVRRRTRASSTSCTCAGRPARTSTGRAPSIRRRSCRSSAASASAGASARTASSSPLDLDSLPDDRRRGGRRLPPLLASATAPHERRVADELRRRYPDAHVVASHEVAPEFREYERASTTAVDAYLGPVLARYLGALGGRLLRAAGLPAPLVMRSSGGVATLEEAAAHAAFALLSGPAAGVVGAARLARARRVRERALVRHGRHLDGRLRDRRRRGARASTSASSAASRSGCRRSTVHTVGAGGGSIVWLDEGGALRVGPESAGAEPGPGLLRARRHAADRHRREPPPRPAARRRLPGGHRARRAPPPSARSAASTRPA